MKNNMTKGSEWKLILLFTLPIMAGNLLQQLYNTVDGIIVGNFVSQTALSAVGTSQPLTFLFLSFAIGMSVGVGVVISQFFGAGKHDKLSPAIDTALILLGGLGLLLTVVAFITAPHILKYLLRVPENILVHSVTYFRIYSLGLFFQFIYNGISFVLRGFGDSKATLYFLIVATIINTVLDLLFVAVFKWSVAGAAWATVIAQIACAAVSYIYLRKRHPFVKGGVHFDGGICKTILKLGLPVAIQHSIVAFGNGAMQRLVNGFGDTSIAAYTVGNRLDSFIFVPIMGFQTGLANFTGQNFGAGRLDRVRRGLRATLVMSISVTVLISIILYIFARTTIAFFGLEGDALRIGTEQIRYLAMFFWSFSLYITLGGVLQGAGDTMLQSIATLTALVVRIITGYLAVYLSILGYNAPWATTPIGWTFAIAITYIRYFSGGWKKKALVGKLHGDETENTEI